MISIVTHGSQLELLPGSRVTGNRLQQQQERGTKRSRLRFRVGTGKLGGYLIGATAKARIESLEEFRLRRASPEAVINQLDVF